LNVLRAVLIVVAVAIIVLFLTSVLRLGAGMISLSAGASMGGDIILQDCGKDFVLPVFLRVSGNAVSRTRSDAALPRLRF
jgi:hypothetical protein